METVIKLTPAELNSELLDKIKTLIGLKKNIDVTISLKEFDNEYETLLNESIEQGENEQGLITFSMEDFMAYTPNKQH